MRMIQPQYKCRRCGQIFCGAKLPLETHESVNELLEVRLPIIQGHTCAGDHPFLVCGIADLYAVTIGETL